MSRIQEIHKKIIQDIIQLTSVEPANIPISVVIEDRIPNDQTDYDHIIVRVSVKTEDLHCIRQPAPDDIYEILNKGYGDVSRPDPKKVVNVHSDTELTHVYVFPKGKDNHKEYKTVITLYSDDQNLILERASQFGEALRQDKKIECFISKS